MNNEEINEVLRAADEKQNEIVKQNALELMNELASKGATLGQVKAKFKNIEKCVGLKDLALAAVAYAGTVIINEMIDEVELSSILNKEKRINHEKIFN